MESIPSAYGCHHPIRFLTANSLRAYKNGAYSTINFKLSGKTLTIGGRQGSYPGMIEKRRFRITFIGGGEPKTVEVEYSGHAVKITTR